MLISFGLLSIPRKTFISELPSLTYLDDRPIFDNERRLVAAWFIISSPLLFRISLLVLDSSMCSCISLYVQGAWEDAGRKVAI